MLTEKLEKIIQDRDIEEKTDNKMIKSLSEVCELNKIRFIVDLMLCFVFQLKFGSKSVKIDDPKMLEEMFRASLKLPDGSDDEILGVCIEKKFDIPCTNKEI